MQASWGDLLVRSLQHNPNAARAGLRGRQHRLPHFVAPLICRAPSPLCNRAPSNSIRRLGSSRASSGRKACRTCREARRGGSPSSSRAGSSRRRARARRPRGVSGAVPTEPSDRVPGVDARPLEADRVRLAAAGERTALEERDAADGVRPAGLGVAALEGRRYGLSGTSPGTAAETSAPPRTRSARERGIGRATVRASSSRNSLKLVAPLPPPPPCLETGRTTRNSAGPARIGRCCRMRGVRGRHALSQSLGAASTARRRRVP